MFDECIAADARRPSSTACDIVPGAMRIRTMNEAIVVDQLHKCYRIYASPTERIRRVFGRSSKHVDFRALHDVSFSIEHGSAVGVIGENGAGKSTLLKLIAGTTSPTLGSLSVDGVVAAILELGAAFHPEFTGRQNAVLYGALMGLEHEDMELRLPRILDFAELGDFIDQPIKCYSTGMAMRLAFAVATHVDPDVLIIDEALAVGDGYFQKKCIDQIRSIKDRGTTILFCSHSMYYISLFCDRAIWIRDGQIEMDGPAQEVVTAYEEFLINRERRRLDDHEEPEMAAATEKHGTQAMIRAIRVLDDAGKTVEGYSPGMALLIEVDWEAVNSAEPVHIGVALERGDGTRLLGVTTFWDDIKATFASGIHTTRLRIPHFPVAKGNYQVSAYLFDSAGLHVWDQVVAPDGLKATSSEWAPAVLELEHHWEL